MIGRRHVSLEACRAGDGSLLMTALGSESLSATELAYQRVEILLAAWEEMHRERLAEQSQGDTK